MANDPSPARRPAGRRILNPSTEPADLVSLVKRRRLTHLIALALLAVCIVAATATPTNTNDSNAATILTGFSFILLVVAGLVSVQYGFRVSVRRRSATIRAPRIAATATATAEPSLPAGSVAHQPIQQLRAAHRLLESVLPDIERLRPGIGVTAEKTRRSLEQTGQRVFLQEQVVASLPDVTNRADPLTAQTVHTLETMTARLRTGVDQYVVLTQQATAAASSLGELNTGQDLQEAQDQLAGLSEGLRDVRRIAGDKA